MEVSLPRPIEVKMLPNVLQIKFDNGATKYLQTEFYRNLVQSFKFKKPKDDFLRIWASGYDTWLGTETKINEDGSVTINDTETYSNEYLWTKSHDETYEL